MAVTISSRLSSRYLPKIFPHMFFTLDDLVKDMHKGNKKRGLAWAYETPFSKVHNKKGEEASEAYLQAVLLAYSSMSPCGISPTGAALARELDGPDPAQSCRPAPRW